jgi:hypothetical protein
MDRIRMLLEARRRTLRGAPAVVAVVATAVLVATTSLAGADVPATLTGESFSGTGTGTTSVVDIFCNSFDNGSTQTFTVSGPATGPYPGTFTETGTFTGTFPTTFSASFTITSGSITVTGTKSGSFVGGSCVFGEPHATMVATGSVAYQATIHTSGGDYADQGTAATSVTLDSDDTAVLNESFQSSLAQPTLIQACQPGHGYGDTNHCHSGPPGHAA